MECWDWILWGTRWEGASHVSIHNELNKLYRILRDEGITKLTKHDEGTFQKSTQKQ